MSIFEDAWDAVSGAVSDVFDVAGDVFEALPGGIEVSGALKDLVNGPLRDFARSAHGKVILRAIATAMYTPLANAALWYGVPLGAQLATIAWALPGLIRGESFDEAWMLEFRWRMEKTAEALGPGIVDMFKGQLKDAIDSLAKEFGIGHYVDLVAEELAGRLGIRVDVAQFAIDLWNRSGPPGRDAFDMMSGRRITIADRVRAATQVDLASARQRQNVEGRAAVIDPFHFANARDRQNVESARVWSPLRTTTATVIRPPPIASSGGTTTPTKRSTTGGDMLLAFTIVAAAGALAYWHHKESKR